MSIIQRNKKIDHMNYSPKCWTRNVFKNIVSGMYQCNTAILDYIKEKECYLAFYVRSKFSMSFDTMTTSLVESMNSSLKRGTYINKIPTLGM